MVEKTKSLTLTDLSSKPLKPGLLLKVVLIRRNMIRASPSHETTPGNHDLTAVSVEEYDEMYEPRGDADVHRKVASRHRRIKV